MKEKNPKKLLSSWSGFYKCLLLAFHVGKCMLSRNTHKDVNTCVCIMGGCSSWYFGRLSCLTWILVVSDVLAKR